jgi:transposase-like protein
MTPRKRRKFTPEFMSETVALYRVGDRSIKQLAADLDLTVTSLRRWVRDADEAAKVADTGIALTSPEREELQRLRKENARLQMEREILKKAAAFFAKESS